MFDMQRNGVTGTEPGAEIRPGIGVGADTVMDVQCGKLPEKTRDKLVQNMQQHDRIDSATQADQNGAVGRYQRRKTRRDFFSKFVSGMHPAPEKMPPRAQAGTAGY